MRIIETLIEMKMHTLKQQQKRKYALVEPNSEYLKNK